MATTNKNFRVKNGLEVGNAIGVGANGTSFGTAGQVLVSNGISLPAEWIDQTSIATSTVKHQVKLAESIAKGQAVYISTATGANMIASKASNTTEGTSSKTMGLLETGGVLNDQVNVITEGMLDNVDVGSASAGDPVWLGTSGNLIYGLANKPIAPAHLVFIGIVTKTGTAGRIFIRVQNGFELNEIHNVLIGTDYTSTPADNNILAYDSANSLWTNQTAEQAGIANLSGATFTGNVAGTNISLSGNVNAITVNATTFTGTAAFATTANAVAVSNITGLGTNVATFLATPSSSNLLNAVTDEDGTGTVVFSNNATLYTTTVIPTSTSTVGLVVKGNASQLSDIQQTQNSSGTVVGGVAGSGQVFINNTAPITSNLQSATISSMSGDGTTISFTTTNLTYLAVGSWVRIGSAVPSGYNGTYQITSSSGNNTYTVLGSATGTVTSLGSVLPSAGLSITQPVYSPGIVVRGNTTQSSFGYLFEGQNSTGTTTSSITPTGTISGSTLSSTGFISGGYGAFSGSTSFNQLVRYSSKLAIGNSGNGTGLVVTSPASGIQDPFVIANNGASNSIFQISSTGKIYSSDPTVVPLKVIASPTNTVAITSIASNGTLVTYTVASNTHNFSAGQTITVSGATTAGYNGTFTITSATPTTIVVTSSATGSTSTASAVASGTQGDLQQWQNNAGSSLASVSSTGIFTGNAIRLTSTTDVDTTSTTHAFQIGADAAANLRIDTNEIHALNNGAYATLLLNELGGNVNVGATTSTVSIPGTISANVINTTSITATGTVSGSELTSTLSSGDEGGQINLAKAVTNTTLAGGITIDVYQNKLRIFEQGGTARGAYIDLTAAAAGVATNLLSGSADGNTTYDISSVTTTGGALLRLTASNPSGTDDVKFAGSGNTTVSYTDASTITISSTDTTYSNGTGLSLSGTTFAIDGTVLTTSSTIDASKINANTITNVVATTVNAGTVNANNMTYTVGSLGTTGTQNLDFATDGYKTMANITGTTTFTASNYVAGKTVTVKIVNGSTTTARTVNFPAGWVFVGVKPTSMPFGKTAILTVTSFSTTEAECVAAWAVGI